jgi:hypothetical protein
MKTKIFITLAIIVFSATMTFATSPQVDLQKNIKSHISYPADFIAQQIQGSVFVEFTVKENGMIEVLNSNSLSGDLMVYVVDELSTIYVNASPELYGQKFVMRFDFKLK